MTRRAGVALISGLVILSSSCDGPEVCRCRPAHPLVEGGRWNFYTADWNGTVVASADASSVGEEYSWELTPPPFIYLYTEVSAGSPHVVAEVGLLDWDLGDLDLSGRYHPEDASLEHLDLSGRVHRFIGASGTLDLAVTDTNTYMNDIRSMQGTLSSTSGTEVIEMSIFDFDPLGSECYGCYHSGD
jgi:hypothetical protein